MTEKTDKQNKKQSKKETAFAIYRQLKDKEASMPYKEFRALVVKEITAKTGVKNAGTLGMYFAWARRVVLNVPAKKYNRSEHRAANGATKKTAAQEARINEALKASKGKTKSKASKAKASKGKAKKAKAKARKR